MTLRWTLPTCLLALCVLFLLLYLLALRRSIREAAEALEEKLRTDTNTLISISTGTEPCGPWPARSTGSFSRSAGSACGCKPETTS